MHIRHNGKKIFGYFLSLGHIKTLTLLILHFGILSTLHAEPQIAAYFSPHGGCTQAIVSAIGAAKKSILVEAYSFTSKPIAQALIAAHQRRARVLVLLDQSELSDPYSVAKLLHQNGIPLFINSAFRIAHSKIMILDGSSVITGSFNFTKSAETSNSENLLIISHAPDLAQKYTTIWNQHHALSTPYLGQRIPAHSNYHHKSAHQPWSPFQGMGKFFHSLGI
jgi:phosphatidylserine/phosphatidylglycerophosphate/cardiolipin synthase-like enzyme